jgi:hypothetical protein
MWWLASSPICGTVDEGKGAAAKAKVRGQLSI